VRALLPALLLLVLATACRGGAAGRAAALPQPTDFAQWVAIAVFVIGLWWVALKIIGLR
jgi:hypothetical protein